MNKKRLSVVMAGAMLATSVAPVLAAEVTNEERSANELGLLQEELRTLLESKVFADDEPDASLRGKSVYALKVNGQIKDLDESSTQEDWQNVFNTIDSDDVIEVWSRGFKEVEGKYYHTELSNKINEDRFDEIWNALQTNGNLNAKYANLIDTVGKDPLSGDIVIKFKDNTGANGENNNTTTIAIGDTDILVGYYIGADKQGHAITASTTPADFYGFPKRTTGNEVVEKAELLRKITITPGGYDLKLEDLYDGLMLTTEGHDFFTMLKEAKAMGRPVTIRGNNSDPVKQWILAANGNGVAVSDSIKMVNKKARFTVTFGAHKGLAAETYTITGLNEANAERFASWMITNPKANVQNGTRKLHPLAKVDILAGSNRYETAVKIAEEYAGLTSVGTVTDNNKIDGNANIVLVNGNALVDGLSAAPLAANKKNGTTSAPILLTEADALPKATKAYLKEVLKEVQIGQLDEVTVHLVGGETVLNKSLERELKSLGFTVERYNGDNREETSLAVAEEIGMEDAFVVGAEGEADAMSIAAVAAETETPIIVAKKGGISEDALYELKHTDATIVGGETVVSKSDYNAIKASAESVFRISGSNRYATNAEIIKKYYKRDYVGMAKNVIVAKDGQRNKMELVDALAAANMASEKNAPIVLATNKLSKDQLNALALNAKESDALYQVGIGVSRDVVKTIATHLGLTNR